MFWKQTIEIDIMGGCKLQSWEPFTVTSRLPHLATLFFLQFGDQVTQWLLSLGTSASKRKHLVPPQCPLQSTPEPWGVWVQRMGA